MDHFEYRNGELFCEDVAVADIAQQVGTPVYIYSKATLLHHYNAINDAFAELNPTVCFAIKCLANLSIMKVLSDAGCGFDVVSGGEVARAVKVGADMSKVVFAGVAKTNKEITEAINAGVGTFNVESEQEFENISRIAGELGKTVRAALRLNPDVYDPKTHTYTTTGKKETKFGVDIERAERFFDAYGKDENAKLDAIHLHIGSPIYSADPYVAAINKTLELIDRLRAKGFEVNTLDIGGGYAADYEEGKSPTASKYAESIVPLLKDKGFAFIIEPGRQIACNAGIMLIEVQYVKQGGDRKFVIADGAMTDLLRPALYSSEHFVYPASIADGPVPVRNPEYQADGGQKVDIVGGVCETSDFLAKDRVLPELKRGDLISIFSAGAYGFTMSSQYNSRPRAAEVLVDGESFKVVRPRESYDDLFASEVL